MRMDFEENDSGPGQPKAQDKAPQQDQALLKDVEQLYDPYLDPEGSRFIDEHQLDQQMWDDVERLLAEPDFPTTDYRSD